MTEGSSRKIALIDGRNLFFRSFAAYPSMTVMGEQAGGVIGFLKTFKRLVEDVKFTEVVIVWEGGGSAQRRALFSEYKQNRKPERLNRFYEDDIPESKANRDWQFLTLVDLLKDCPVCQVYVPNCEADDVIAHLCSRFNEDEKVIVSSDKDFFQLLDGKTSMYLLNEKTFFTVSNCVEKYGITSKNFALAKAMCGDASDNIPGIPGMGFKTAAKRFPLLGSEDDVLIQQIIDYANAHINEAKIYKSVVEHQDILKRNWRLVYLSSTMISPSQIAKVDYVIEKWEPKASKINFIKKFNKAGLTKFEIDEFFVALNLLLI